MSEIMDEAEFEERLKTMSVEELDALMRRMGKPFDDFARDLATGSIKELAPPFDDYQSFQEGLLEYYKLFFLKYRHYLNNIDDNTWNFVNQSMSAFIEYHGGPKVEFDIIKEYDSLTVGIISSLSAYLNGLPNIAYNYLEKVFVEKDCHLLKTLPQIQYQGALYRVRGERNLKDSKELFHTPFELRNRCGSYRYSILGYPSLYLAGSLDTSLAECRIDNNVYSAVCFRSVSPLCCADLSLPNRELSFWERYSLVLFYPLIFACGLKVKEETRPFKPEYVIPQILFQIISERSDLMGVSYTSTRMEHVDFRDSRQRNFVLIVPKADQSKGQSEVLAESLTCTMPISPEVGDDSLAVERKLNGMEAMKMSFLAKEM